MGVRVKIAALLLLTINLFNGLRTVKVWDLERYIVFSTARAGLFGCDGSLYTYDLLRKEIVALYPDGKVRVVARKGEGPGEFRLLICLALHNCKLYIFDRGKRLIILDKNGQYEKTIFVKTSKKFYYTPHYIDLYKNLLIVSALFAEPPNFFDGDLIGTFELSDKAKFIKSFFPVKELFKGSRTSYLLRVLIKVRGDNLFVLPTDDLILYQYSLPKIELVRTIKLERPKFFKPLRKPLFLKSGFDPKKIEIMREYLHSWTVPYYLDFLSPEVLVLGIRTNQINTDKSYAVLLYSFPEGKLLDSVLSDEYFYGVENGRFYFLNEVEEEKVEVKVKVWDR